VQNGEATQNIIKHIATLFIAGYLHKFNKNFKECTFNNKFEPLSTKKIANLQFNNLLLQKYRIRVKNA
jgi:hypothetical protein